MLLMNSFDLAIMFLSWDNAILLMNSAIPVSIVGIGVVGEEHGYGKVHGSKEESHLARHLIR